MTGPSPVGARRIGAVALRVIESLAVPLVLICLIHFGLEIRKTVWQKTDMIRYAPDMQNAWRWGAQAEREGYFSLYDRVVDAHRNETGKINYVLDYVPLRLGVMTLWAKSRLASEPTIKDWRNTYEFNAPLLWFNSVMELLTAAAVLSLARYWLGRHDRSLQISRSWFRSEWLALLAFAFAWLNPASIISAHARPTWDVWVAPFFLWAVFCAGVNSWFCAGLIMGVGAMFKGQVLIVLPVLILWPLMRFRIGALARFVSGFALASALIVSPWIVGTRVAPIAFVIVLSLAGPLAWWLLHVNASTSQAISASRFAFLRRLRLNHLRLRGAHLRWIIPASLAIAMWLCIPIFKTSTSWFTLGFVYGANRFEQLEVGGASCLASILQQSYGWDTHMSVEWPKAVGLGFIKTISDAMIAIYVLLLIPIAWALHRYARAGDRRFLLALATPWIVYFAFFPKMHERYLLWGALCACTAFSVSLGASLLAILLSISSCAMSLMQLLRDGNPDRFLKDVGPHAGRTLKQIIDGTYPGMGWALMLAALVWWWMVVAGAFHPIRPIPGKPAA